MTRPDVKKKHLADFVDWSLSTLTQADERLMTDVVVMDGTLQSLVKTLVALACACITFHRSGLQTPLPRGMGTPAVFPAAGVQGTCCVWLPEQTGDLCQCVFFFWF